MPNPVASPARVLRVLPAALLLMAVSSLLAPDPAAAQQIGDPDYTPPVEHPNWPRGEGPLVRVDEAHHNFHTIGERYAPFAELLRMDGYRVEAHDEPFTARSLAGARVLVISNALHPSDTTGWILPNPSAFTEDEINALAGWVRRGGSLMLIADHMPFPGAADELAAHFGFEMSNGFAIPRSGNLAGPLVFRTSDGTLARHPVTRGVDSVASFTGQGFRPPPEAVSLMDFPGGFVSLMPDTAWIFHENTPVRSLEGWSQGALRTFGGGRVAVFGEAAMFNAQVSGPQRSPMGMNAPAASLNWRFLLNVMRWLSGERP